ncbi:hypothetical protein LMG24238_03945 [Paraburkholderia sediminicola]|uniref:Uncharacterized protein n=1 Tax=Paraburkholderia sediminicola TaxID=458836 RepID=A0A6J5BIG6_9BURK|nr:hypothetical protein LMG24238_03945 [Paraburkholderia sediminicola]
MAALASPEQLLDRPVTHLPLPVTLSSSSICGYLFNNCNFSTRAAIRRSVEQSSGGSAAVHQVASPLFALTRDSARSRDSDSTQEGVRGRSICRQTTATRIRQYRMTHTLANHVSNSGAQILRLGLCVHRQLQCSRPPGGVQTCTSARPENELMSSQASFTSASLSGFERQAFETQVDSPVLVVVRRVRPAAQDRRIAPPGILLPTHAGDAEVRSHADLCL